MTRVFPNQLWTLLFCGMAFCAIGCNTNAGAQKNASLQSLKASPSGLKTARLFPEPAAGPQPGSAGSLADEKHAWATNATDGLLRTTDGGQSWQRMRVSTADESTLGLLTFMYFKVFFLAPSRGWLTGERGTWQTNDGGTTWQSIFDDPYDDVNFGDDKHGWMSIQTEGSRRSYVTADGGDSWAPCGPIRDYHQQGPGQVSYFLTPKIGWSVSRGSDEKNPRIISEGVTYTANGGCDWKQLWISKNRDARYADIYFLSQREGWLAGELALYHSTDSGKTWERVSRPTDQTNVVHVYFETSEVGWIIGGHQNMRASDTGLYYTRDGGYTWRQLTANEIVDGFEAGGLRTGIPEKWKAGKLFQMFYRSAKSG